MNTTRYRIVEIVTCVVIACVVIPLSIGYVYGTNDEAVFRLISEQKLAPVDQSDHLVFINILVGRFLKLLYGLAPGWFWFDLLTQTIVVVSAVALFALARSVALRHSREYLTIALVGGVAVAAASPHFTQTAAIAAAAGLSLIVWTNRVPQKRGGVLLALLGVALYVAGGLYRGESAELVLVLFMPALLLALSDAADRFRQAMIALALLAAVGLNLSAQSYDDYVYATEPEWSTFGAHNTYRNEVVDFGKFARRVCGKSMFARAEKVGWSRNDVRMLQSFSFSNPRLFSTERVKALATALKDCNARSLNYFRQYLRWRIANAPYLMLPMLLVLLLGACTSVMRAMLAIVGAYALYAIAVWLAVECLFKPLPPPVAFSFAISAWCFVLTAARRYSAAASQLHSRLCSPAILAALLVVVVSSEVAKRDPVSEGEQAFTERVFSAGFDRIFPIGGSAALERLVRPFAPIEPRLSKVRMDGWLGQTPFQQRDPVLREGGDFLLHACTTRKEAILMTQPNESMVATYIAEHFDTAVEFDELASGGSWGVRLVQCRVLEGRSSISRSNSGAR